MHIVRPVLFLDVDGVLNSTTFFVAKKPESVMAVDPAAVRRIQRIVAKTNAYVVLSSSWRKSQEDYQYLRDSGVPIDEFTPVFDTSIHGYVHRGVEIAEWLGWHPEVHTFAILDDDADAGAFFPNHFVRCYGRYGMYGKHEKLVLELLGKGE